MYTETERQEGLEYLRNKMYGANEIVIIDPYFLKKDKKKEAEDNQIYLGRTQEYLEEIKKVLGEARKILIITHYHNETYENDLKNIFQEKNISYKILITKKLHDRLWIKDKSECFVVGSSFNGIGLKLGFIYELKSSRIKDRINEYFIKKIKSNGKVKKEIKNEMIDCFRN